MNVVAIRQMCAYNPFMSNEQELSSKLKRLGVVKGARNLKPAPPPDPALLKPIRPSTPSAFSNDEIMPLDTLLPGSYLAETAVGNCLILDKVYPLSYEHGRYPLQALFNFGLADTAVMTKDERFQALALEDVLFLDTETTGLAGAGTIAFMVGVAFFESNSLVLRQYFVPDFGDEAAMLTLLEALLADKTSLITFNGRTFDVPLLDGRFLMNRMASEVRQMPHFDLLPPARRLWRARLGSVALSALERPLLGVQRTHEDVPGWLIPSLYQAYVRNGDGRELVRVFYHNQIDLLSMVTLATQTIRQFTQPSPDDDPRDLYSLGRWQMKLGLPHEAEKQLKLAARGDLPLDLFHQNLYELGLLLKRDGRRAEAVPLWQQIAATSFEDVNAHIELAKYYEWHDQNIAQAIFWTEQAIALMQQQRSAIAILDELAHRLNRLQTKEDKQS